MDKSSFCGHYCICTSVFREKLFEKEAFFGALLALFGECFFTYTEQKKNISANECNRWMHKFHHELGKAILPNVNLGLMENMLCEFKREAASQTSTSRIKDCIFKLDHRGSWQNLYRLEFKSTMSAILHICPGKQGIPMFKKKPSCGIGSWVIVPSSSETHDNICWINSLGTSMDKLYLEKSKLHLPSRLCKCFSVKT